MQSPEDYRQSQIGGYGPGPYHLVIGSQNPSHDMNKGLQPAPAGMYAPSTASMPGAGPQHHQPGQPPSASLVQPQQINHRPLLMNNIQGRPTAQMASLSRNAIGNVPQAPPQGAQQYSHVQNVMLQSQVHPSLHTAPMSSAAQPMLIPQQVFFPHRAMPYHHQQQQFFVTNPYPYGPPNNTFYPIQSMPSCPAPVNNVVPETQPSHKSSQKKILEIINPDTGANVIAEVLSQNERRDNNRSGGSEAAITFATQVAAVAASTESSGLKEDFEPQSMPQRQGVNSFEGDRESSSFEISTPDACDQYDEDVNSNDAPSLSFSDKDSIEISISDNIPTIPDLERNIESLQSTEVVVTNNITNHEDSTSTELSPEYETTNSEIPEEELAIVEADQQPEDQESGNTNCAVQENEIQNFVEELSSPVQSDEAAQVLSPSPPSEAITICNKPLEGSVSTCNALKLDKLPPEGKKKGKKKKDINKKGDSKEGSEMDAFIGGDSTPTPESPPASVVTQPPLPPPSPEPEPVLAPLPSTELPAVTTVIQDIVIETIVDRSLLNSIPLPNEDASAEEPVEAQESLEEVVPEDKSVEVKEDGDVSPQEPRKTPLKYTYKEDQWSPLNPEGKKQYDRDFLLKLQQQPMSLKKPINLPNLDVIKDQAHLHKLDSIARIPPLPMPSRRMNTGFDPFVPQFVHPSPRPQMHPGMRRSQQGRNDKAPKKVVFSSSLNQNIKLHESENAWKAGKPTETDNTAIEDLYKKFRGILNKLTPQKFNTLLVQVQELEINTEEKLKGVIDLVFEKAIDEPNFSVPYANLCKQLALMKVPCADREGECVNFRKLLLTKCQKEFEKDQSDEVQRKEKMKQIAECDTESQKKTLQEEFDEQERINRRRQLGNIRFIGELFKFSMLTEPIMHECIKKLLQQRDEDSLECLCRLLTTIGKELETKRGKDSNDFQEKKDVMISYFTEMKKIIGERKASSRVRFMLQDVIDLRDSNWVPRRDDNNPKTIDQIHKEAEKEAHEQQLALHNMQFNAPKRPPDDNRKKSTNQGREADGWTVTSRTGKIGSGYSNNIDPSKLKVFGRPEIESIQLGPSGRGFMSWSRGSSGGYKQQSREQENKPAAVLSSNRYMALSIDQSIPNMDTRRGSQRSAASSRESSRGRNNQVSPMIRKTPSASKEREIAIEATMQLARASQAEQKAAKESVKVPEVKNVNGKDAIVPAEANVLKGMELSREEIEKKTKPLMDEFLHTADLEEATRCVTELVSSNTMHMFIADAINQVLERSSQARCLFGQLLQKLVHLKLLTMEQYNKGMWSVLEIVDDYALDIPKIWEYLGEIIQPMIDGNLSLKFLEETLRPCIPSLSAGKVMAAILHCAAKTNGQHKTSQVWNESGLKWSNFLPPEEDVSKFTSAEKLEFISSPCRVEVPPAEAKKKFDTLLNADQIDSIFEWIDSNLGAEKMKEPIFIRTLVTAIFENAITGSGDKCDLSIEKVKSATPLMVLYIGKQKDLQLPALYALQALVNRLDQPKGVLDSIFNHLYDEEIILEDSYRRWMECKDPAEQEGKGVAVVSVHQFFNWLFEADDEG